MGKASTERAERQVAKRAQAERELAEARLRTHKRWIVLGGSLILLGLICFAAVRWLLSPLSTEIKGRLGGVGELSFVEGTQSFGGISPVCGCAHPALDSWRGVEFAGREVILEQRRSPWAQWAISSAEPKSIDLGGGRKVILARAYRLKPAGAFNPFSLVGTASPAKTLVLDAIDVEAETFSMLTRGELRVSLTGPVPIGAWIPFPGSDVRLTASRSPFPGQQQRPRLVESYPSQIGFWPDRDGDMHPREPQVYPVGDFLGPNLVFWSEDPNTRVVGSAFGGRAPPGVITAVVISASVFSTRIGAVPIHDGFVAISENLSLEDPSGYGEYVSDASGETGTVAVTVEKPLARDDYRDVRRRVRSDPKTWTEIPSHLEFESGRKLPGEWEEQHFPPLPDHVGFNVFGPLNAVAFEHVFGDLTIGDRHLDLSGSGDLGLNQVKGFRNGRDEQLVAAPLATASESADLQFEAEGTVEINGIAQATARSEYEPLLRVVALVLGLAGGVIGLVNGLKAQQDRRNSLRSSL